MSAEQSLRESPVFTALSDADIKAIAAIAIEKEFSAGATIFTEGQSAEELFVLREGKVAVQMAVPLPTGKSSRRVTVDVVNRNDVFGWSSLVEPYLYTMAGVCLQKTKVLAINSARLRALLRADHNTGFEVMTKLIKLVASRLDDTRHVLMSERVFAAKLE